MRSSGRARGLLLAGALVLAGAIPSRLGEPAASARVEASPAPVEALPSPAPEPIPGAPTPAPLTTAATGAPPAPPDPGKATGGAGTVGPEKQKPELTEIDRSLANVVKTLLERVAVHGTLDLDYVYNVADPPGITDVNRLRLNDPDSNSFEVGWVKLAVLRETTSANEWDAGFHLAFAAGREVVNTLSLDPNFLFQQPFNVAQAYVDLQTPTPLGNPLLLRAGRFYGWFGVESLDTALNPNFSLSWFTRFTPFTTTGFGAGMNLGAGFRYMQYLVNGWDLVIDDNTGKTVGGQLSWEHIDAGAKVADYRVAFNWIWGPELPNDTRHDRTQLELAASAHPFPGTTFLAVADLGEGAVSTTTLPAALQRLTGKFGGVMLIARQELGEVSKDFYRVALAGRIEVWRDEGGLNSGLDQTLLDTTGTVEVHFTEFARLRFEVRRDQSSRDHFFVGHRGLPSSDQQVTLSVDAALSF
jgi:hypothetical protein